MADTEGERLMRAYLHERRLPCEEEPPVGGFNPDFLMHSPVGDVVAEVYDPTLTLPGRVGAYDSITPLLGAFGTRKRKQVGAACKAGYPTIVVLGKGNSDLTFDDFTVTGALFGRPGVTFPVGPGAPPDAKPAYTFLDGAAFQPTKNTSYSAVAVVSQFNPTLRHFQRATAALPSVIWGESTHQERVAHVEEMMEIERELEAAGVYKPDACRTRLTIYRNPWAARPLPWDFAGPHDDQFDLFETARSVGYTLVARGVNGFEVPTDR